MPNVSLEKCKGATSLLVTSMSVAGSLEPTINREYGYVKVFAVVILLSTCIKFASGGDFASACGEPAITNDSFA